MKGSIKNTLAFFILAIGLLISDCSSMYAANTTLRPIKFYALNPSDATLLKVYEKKINHLKLDSLSVITTLKKVENEFRSDGYLTATFDSICFLKDEINVFWSVGNCYSFASINISKEDKSLLNNLGYKTDKSVFRPAYFSRMMNALVTWGCDNGYPFALAKLRNVNLSDTSNNLKADLFFDKGKSFTLDSIVIKGNCKLNQNYFYNYLDIQEGDLFNEGKINKWTFRLKEIPFVSEVRPFELEYNENLYHPVFYLQNKKASMLNGIVGFQSDNANTGKVYLTGDVKVKLMNVFGHAELIDFNWNNPQPRTQDLKIKFNYPYLFNFPFGVEGDFSLFKKDTLWFEVNRQIGIQYLVNGNNAIKVFAGKKTNSLISVDAYKNQTSLPDVADMQLLNYGIGVQWQNLDYRFNPHHGYDINFTGSAGQRTIKKNIKFPVEWYDSLNLKSNQYGFDLNADYYFSLSKFSVLNFGVMASHLQGEKYFSNELIRFGGLKTLRGFNETSFSASSLMIAKLEYRFLLEQNSFLFLFFNQAYYEDKSKLPVFSDKPYGLGAGINFETKAGIFSFTYAVGSLQDEPLSFKAAKIHFGLVNLF
jgi:outer membrane protein assembly factor BamA